jgi:proteasome assembly chaperone (PAC2) family protein
MAEAKEILDKLKQLKSKSDNMSMRKSRATVNGALIGAAGGLLVGLARNYSLISSAMVGSVLGALVTYLILPKSDNDEE